LMLTVEMQTSMTRMARQPLASDRFACRLTNCQHGPISGRRTDLLGWPGFCLGRPSWVAHCMFFDTCFSCSAILECTVQYSVSSYYRFSLSQRSNLISACRAPGWHVAWPCLMHRGAVTSCTSRSEAATR
jgi:hypothetical protein